MMDIKSINQLKSINTSTNLKITPLLYRVCTLRFSSFKLSASIWESVRKWQWKRLSVHVPPAFPKLYSPFASKSFFLLWIVGHTARLWKGSHTHRHTHRKTAPILWPRPLTREVKTIWVVKLVIGAGLKWVSISLSVRINHAQKRTSPTGSAYSKCDMATNQGLRYISVQGRPLRVHEYTFVSPLSLHVHWKVEIKSFPTIYIMIPLYV